MGQPNLKAALKPTFIYLDGFPYKGKKHNPPFFYTIKTLNLIRFYQELNMIIKPTSPIEALVAFAVTFALGALTICAANHYGKLMYRKGQAVSARINIS